jgi:hypothetical protein
MSSTLDTRATDPPPRVASAARGAASDVWIYLLLAALTVGAWRFSRLGLFRAGDDVGYTLGLVGGVMMLLLFTYPLRKYVRALHGWGKVKVWFVVHMVLGVGAPLLILLHSTFHVGSLNAAVALYSMLVVAASGVIGRFIYLRVHRGLSGEKANLRALQARAGLDRTEAGSRLHFAPAIEARLQAFAEAELNAPPGWATWLRQIFALPLHSGWVYLRCRAELRAPLRRIAARRDWSRADTARRRRLAGKLVRRYLASVVRVAQFTAYERLFALWHVAHVPFVYLLVISAVVHVVAVHAY